MVVPEHQAGSPFLSREIRACRDPLIKPAWLLSPVIHTVPYMLDTIISRAKGILAAPDETFREARADDQNLIAAYIAAIVFVNTILSYAAAMAGFLPPGWETSSPGIPMMLISLIIMPIFGIIGFLIASLWLHLWVYVCGGRKPHARTFIATAYSSTPVMLLGWIPVIGPVFALWMLVLLVLGLRECQEMSTQRAILAVFIAILPVIIEGALVLLSPQTFSAGAWPFGPGLRIANT